MHTTHTNRKSKQPAQALQNIHLGQEKQKRHKRLFTLKIFLKQIMVVNNLHQQCPSHVQMLQNTYYILNLFNRNNKVFNFNTLCNTVQKKKKISQNNHSTIIHLLKTNHDFDLLAENSHQQRALDANSKEKISKKVSSRQLIIILKTAHKNHTSRLHSQNFSLLLHQDLNFHPFSEE